jgi:hypothetical protein
MKLTSLVGEKRILLIACMFILAPVLLASCGGETTVIEEAAPGETTIEETTVEEGEAAPEEEAATPEPAPSPTPSPAPSPTPAPTPTPTPPPVPPPTPLPLTQVNCGIGAGGALSCTNTAGVPFSCSGDSSAVGSRYSCTGPGGGDDTYGCDVVASRAGGFTLSCTRLLQ